MIGKVFNKDFKGFNFDVGDKKYRFNVKDVNKDKIRKAIKDVSTKQFCALSKWTKENPDFQNNEYKQNYYTHTLVAIANTKDNNEEKIIKKLCNNSYIKED